VVKLIGVGGVGGFVARPVTMFLAALGGDARLVLIDGDSFELANASRMFFGAIGNKAAVVRDELLPRFRDSRLAITAIEEYVTPENIRRLIRCGDVVILAVDNHATRKLVNDHCASLDDICLISGGNDGVETTPDGQIRKGTFGNVQIYLRRGGCDHSPSLTRYHPEIAEPADKSPADASCTELAASVPQIMFANLTVATAMLNSFWLYCSDALHYPELVFDIAAGVMRPVELPMIRPGAGDPQH
jgi:hypothetical protein